jgi:hypothetical protein
MSRPPLGLASLVSYVALTVAADTVDNCLTFQRVSDYAMPLYPFSVSDDLPQGEFTLAFHFRLFARRQPSSYNVLGIKLNNLLAPNTLPDGSIYIDFNDQSFQLPRTVDLASGWHHLAVTFDASTGVLRCFVDGEQARRRPSAPSLAWIAQSMRLRLVNTRPLQVLNEASRSQGKRSVGTFGPDGIFTFVLFQLAYVDQQEPSLLRGTSALPSLPVGS